MVRSSRPRAAPNAVPRTQPIGPGAREGGRSGIALRVIVALIPWIVLKLLVRYSLIRVYTDSLVGAFAVLDILFLGWCVPWIATGHRLPADLAAVLRRSWFVATAAYLPTVATNLALQVGPSLLRAENHVHAIGQVVFVALPRSAVGGVPGAILLAMAAFIAASIICILRLAPERWNEGRWPPQESAARPEARRLGPAVHAGARDPRVMSVTRRR